MKIQQDFHGVKECDGIASYPQTTRGVCSSSCLAFFRSHHHE